MYARQVVRNTRRIMANSRRNWPVAYWGLIICSGLSAALMYVSPLVTAWFVDGYGAGNFTTTTSLILPAALLAASMSGAYLISSTKNMFDRILFMRVVEWYDHEFASKRAQLDICQREDPKIEDLFMKARHKGMFSMVRLQDIAIVAIEGLAGLTIAMAIMLKISPLILLLISIGAIPRLIVELRYGRIEWSIYNEDTPKLRHLNHLRHHLDAKHPLTELKIFGNVAQFLSKMKETMHIFNSSILAKDQERYRWHVAAACVLLALNIASIWIGLGLLTTGEIKIGGFLLLIATAGSFQGSITGFLSTIASFTTENRPVQAIFDVLDLEQALPDASDAVDPAIDAPPLIEFENISFSYPGQTKPVLNNLTLTIHPGETIAIIGANGAGKSTLINLLCRHYDPTSGSIKINGVDLRKIKRSALYNMAAMISQDYATYCFPVEEVIGLGRSKVPTDHTRIRNAAKRASAEEFISSWPDGYRQMIGKQFDGGIDPSKGQSQKLALARVFYRDARLIILDEPTASVDAASEAAIFDQLSQKDGSQTIILISHRFSTVRKADRIIVLEDGGISEQGTHSELMERAGTYARLFALQAAGYQD